jgi:hypothetical protein
VTDEQAYHELCYYTLAHPDPAFIHQHVVDAFAAQHAAAESKPIAVAFALIGLYLHLERNFSGREVQDMHVRLAHRRRAWPCFELPRHRGELTVHDVVAAPPGADRDVMIRNWCGSVWDEWKQEREAIITLLNAAQ